MPDTDRFASAHEYRQWVEMVARNAAEMGDTESPTTVADHVIVDVTAVTATETALTLGAEPYVDDPAAQTRLYPKDVLAMHPPSELPAHPDSYRDAAVHLLARELESALRQHRHDASA